MVSQGETIAMEAHRRPPASTARRAAGVGRAGEAVAERPRTVPTTMPAATSPPSAGPLELLLQPGSSAAAPALLLHRCRHVLTGPSSLYAARKNFRVG